MPYIKNKQVFVCPSGNPGDYGVNPAVVSNGSAPSVAIGQVQKPAETILLADVTAAYGDYTTGQGGNRQGGSELRATTPANITAAGPASLCHSRSLWGPRHNEQANTLFCDGHAKIMRCEATYVNPLDTMWDTL